MNFHVLSWLLFFLAPGGCPIYSINVSTLEVPSNDFQNELTLHTMLSSELQEYRNDLDGAVPSKKNNNFSPMLFKELAKVARSSHKPVEFLGTNLFDCQRKTCFSLEEMALMSARRTLEQLVPKSYPNCLLTDSLVHMLIRFVYTVNRIVQEMSDESTRRLPQRAFYDALGGYLRYYLVPAAQISFYAGRLKLKTIQCLLKIKRQSYIVLNTNGNSWRSPAKDIMCQFKGAKIEPIELAGPKFEDGAASCSLLDQSSVSQDSDQGQMIVPLPQLEPVDCEGHLSNIFLPFRQRRIYNLRSPRCASVVVRFFKTVTSCHRFQEKSQANYNNKLLNWIRENVHSHYIDEMFYPGLGGILQIQETLLHMAKEQEESKAEEDKSCYVAESRKVSRSTGNWQADPEPSQEEEHQDLGPAEQEHRQGQDQEHDECRECESNSSLIWYIVAFLVLLLIIIVIVIWFCMRRSRRRNDKTPMKPVDVEAPPSLKERRLKKGKERSKGGDGISIYYGEQNDNRSSSSLNCQLKNKCLPTKITSKKGNSYYPNVSEETSPQRKLLSLTSAQFNFSPSSDIADKGSMHKQKRRKSQEKKRRGHKDGGSGQSYTAKSSADRKNSSPQEKRRADRVRIDTEESSYEARPHRKMPDETRAGKSSRLKGGTASSNHSMKDTPSWETTFDDI